MRGWRRDAGDAGALLGSSGYAYIGGLPMASTETLVRPPAAAGELATWWRMRLPPDVVATLQAAPEVLVPRSRSQLLKLSLGETEGQMQFEVAYDVPGRGRIVEAVVTRCRNGVAVNYVEPYMRRRDPDCMVVADEGPSEKPRSSTASMRRSRRCAPRSCAGSGSRS